MTRKIVQQGLTTRSCHGYTLVLDTLSTNVIWTFMSMHAIIRCMALLCLLPSKWRLLLLKQITFPWIRLPAVRKLTNPSGDLSDDKLIFVRGFSSDIQCSWEKDINCQILFSIFDFMSCWIKKCFLCKETLQELQAIVKHYS